MERISSVEAVPEHGSFLFTVEELSGRKEEVILVHADGLAAWKNFCMHEPDQKLDRGLPNGAAMRDAQIICPRHGSMFDAETGYCDNGDARGQTLVEVDITVNRGDVFLTDDGLSFLHEGPIEEDDGMPGSTSHIGF